MPLEIVSAGSSKDGLFVDPYGRGLVASRASTLLENHAVRGELYYAQFKTGITATGDFLVLENRDPNRTLLVHSLVVAEVPAAAPTTDGCMNLSLGLNLATTGGTTVTHRCANGSATSQLSLNILSLPTISASSGVQQIIWQNTLNKLHASNAWFPPIVLPQYAHAVWETIRYTSGAASWQVGLNLAIIALAADEVR